MTLSNILCVLSLTVSLLLVFSSSFIKKTIKKHFDTTVNITGGQLAYNLLQNLGYIKEFEVDDEDNEKIEENEENNRRHFSFENIQGSQEKKQFSYENINIENNLEFDKKTEQEQETETEITYLNCPQIRKIDGKEAIEIKQEQGIVFCEISDDIYDSNSLSSLAFVAKAFSFSAYSTKIHVLTDVLFPIFMLPFKFILQFGWLIAILQIVGFVFLKPTIMSIFYSLVILSIFVILLGWFKEKTISDMTLEMLISFDCIEEKEIENMYDILKLYSIEETLNCMPILKFCCKHIMGYRV